MHFSFPIPRIRYKARGFTLIELLVVIAIIAILAAILFPVFARARENARRSSCQSNLKQIGIGVMQYTQDFDENYPIFLGNNDNSKPDYGWAAVIQPYIKSTQVFQCPSEPTPPSVPLVGGANYTDYAYNMNLGQNATFTIKVSKLEATAVTLMATDWTSSYAYREVGWANSSPPWTDYSVAADKTRWQRHLEGDNILFCDSHVKWLKPEKVTNGDPATGNPTFCIVKPGTGLDTCF